MDSGDPSIEAQHHSPYSIAPPDPEELDNPILPCTTSNRPTPLVPVPIHPQLPSLQAAHISGLSPLL
jgi:hypothetical protein